MLYQGTNGKGGKSKSQKEILNLAPPRPRREKCRLTSIRLLDLNKSPVPLNLWRTSHRASIDGIRHVHEHFRLII